MVNDLPPEGEEGIGRVRLPQRGEQLGVVLGILGGGRLRIACKDKKERICRIPGKIRKRLWIKDGDIVLIEPWSIEGDKKGDIIWRYSKLHAIWLKKNGHM